MPRTALLAALAALALIPAAAAETLTASLGGQDVEIEYTATELEVTSGRFAGISLILDVVSTGNPSSLVITLDRSVIDTLEGEGGLNEFHVLEDDFPIDMFEESETTATHRTLRIPVSTDIVKIEIVGELVSISQQQEPPAPPVPDMAPDPADVAPEPPADATEPRVEEAPPAPDATVPPEPEPPADPAPPAEEPAPPADVAPPVPPVEPEPPMEPGPSMDAPGEMSGGSPSTCGPGTTLADDGTTCVLAPSASGGTAPYRELVFGAGAGVVISLVAAAIMYGIGRAGRP
ncbi:MAG: hypothetical protein OXU86_05020 [Thaumarchaeota archaeon]|nr:hypothetical protein [Nitrososphaerota archaeon]